MSHYSIKLDEEIEKLYGQVVSNMERAAQLASLANQIEKVLPEVQLPSADVVLQFGASGDRRLTGLLGASCIEHSLIGMMSACEQYLRHLTFVVTVGVTQASSDGPIRGDVFEDMRDEAVRDTSALWNVFEGLLKALGRTRSTIKSRGWFASLDRIRNCLVHRGGLVGELDVGKEGALEATWRRTSLTGPEGAVITSLPFKADKGGTFGVNIAEQTRIWRKGEQIILNVQDCHDMAFTLAEFCNDVRIQVHNGLRELLVPKGQQERN